MKYLVIEAAHGDYYGFNTKVEKEREIAEIIVSDYEDFMIKGWKVSKKLPEWVHNADSWIDFINEKDVDDMEIQGVKGRRGKQDEDNEDIRQGYAEADDDKQHDDDEEEEKEDEKEEDEVEDDEEDEETDEEAEGENEDNVEDGNVGEENDEDDEKEQDDEKEEGGEEEEDEEEDDVEENIVNTLLSKTADPLPFRGAEAWQGDPVETDRNKKAFTKVNDKKAAKKGDNKKENQTLGRDIFNNRDEDASIFASINGADFRKEVAKSVKSSMKTNTIDIYITGPFRNAKTDKSTWIAVFGDYGSAWTLKSQFLKGYIGTLVKRIKTPNINIGHTKSFYDINIRKVEYGKESLWRRKDGNKTTKRLSFAYTCETVNEKNGKKGLLEAVQFFFKTMKKRDINPIGPLVVEFLKDHASSLYEYLLKKKPNEELLAEDITDDIDKHFNAGFVTHWDDYLNHWMVDYDIIRILKDHVGYSSWTDVPSKQRGLCYKNYNHNVTLPKWDIDQERY